MERDQKPEKGYRQTRNMVVIKIREIKVFWMSLMGAVYKLLKQEKRGFWQTIKEFTRS